MNFSLQDRRRLWDAFWVGGIANPLEVIEQITYLLGMAVRSQFSANG